MNQLLKPIGVRDFIAKFAVDEQLFDALPEFQFIHPLAEKAKRNNCTCGMGPEIHDATFKYNEVVESLTEDAINRVKVKFDREKACFIIQTSETYYVKCY